MGNKKAHRDCLWASYAPFQVNCQAMDVRGWVKSPKKSFAPPQNPSQELRAEHNPLKQYIRTNHP